MARIELRPILNVFWQHTFSKDIGDTLSFLLSMLVRMLSVVFIPLIHFDVQYKKTKDNKRAHPRTKHFALTFPQKSPHVLSFTDSYCWKPRRIENERMLPLDFKWSEKKTKRFSLSNTSSKKGGWVEDETLSVLLGWRQAEAGWVLNSFHRHYSEQAVVLNVSCVTQCVLFTVCFV